MSIKIFIFKISKKALPFLIYSDDKIINLQSYTFLYYLEKKSDMNFFFPQNIFPHCKELYFDSILSSKRNRKLYKFCAEFVRIIYSKIMFQCM